MEQAINFTNVGIILLDILLVFGCWAVDKHLRMEAIENGGD